MDIAGFGQLLLARLLLII